MRVFGADIIRGSVRSRSRRPVYALVVMEDGEETTSSEVSLFRLLRRVAQESPDVLAVDSVQEIATDQRELYSVLQSLPPETTLVQVTGGERQESLPKVAGRYNISFDRRDPFAEARASAQLASLGVGAEVIAFADTSEVIVSRSRSPGKGGWSQNRYARKIHRAVQQKGIEIVDILDNAGIAYTKTESKAFGGFSRVQFHVMARRPDLPVRTHRGPDVQVKVRGNRLERIRFRSLTRSRRYLIVGIDPGTTMGIAALDLDGNLVRLMSARQISISDASLELTSAGRPLVIASDVAHMPATVEKIRRAFRAVAYLPKSDRTQDEKAAVCSGYSYANDHERDSLSAALDAYRSYAGKFRNIARRVPPGVDLDEVRAGVVRGLSMEQALQSMAVPEKTEPEAEAVEKPAPAPGAEKVAQMEAGVRRLREYVAELQEESAAKDANIWVLRAQIRRERTERAKKACLNAEVTKREGIIKGQKKRLRKEEKKNKKLLGRINRLKRFSELQMNGVHMPVKVLGSLTHDSQRELESDLGIGEGDILAVMRTDGWGPAILQALASTHVRAICVRSPDKRLLAACREVALPLLVVRVQVRGRTGTVAHDAFEKALSEWQEGQQVFDSEKRHEMLESIVSEYRSEREVEVRRRG